MSNATEYDKQNVFWKWPAQSLQQDASVAALLNVRVL